MFYERLLGARRLHCAIFLPKSSACVCMCVCLELEKGCIELYDLVASEIFKSFLVTAEETEARKVKKWFSPSLSLAVQLVHMQSDGIVFLE